MKQFLTIGSKVRIAKPMAVPPWCEYDDDRGRVAKHVKNVIRERFFKGDTKLNAEIVHVPNETQREKLRKAGRTKVRVRMPSGETIVITVEMDNLVKA